MSVETPFSSPDDARDAFYGDGDGGGGDGGGDGGTGWGELSEVDMLAGGWALLSQDQIDGNRTRWFVAGGPEGGYMTESGGGVVFPDDNETLADMPSFGTEDEAREAHAAWVEENAPEDDEGSEWTDWTRFDESEPWFLFEREHVEEDRAQFLAAGEDSDGGTVYLQADGSVDYDPHVFESSGALNDALDAYADRVAEGDVPEDREPTGTMPDGDTIEGDTPDDGPGGLVATLAETATSPLGLAAAAGAGYLLYKRGESA